MPAVCDATLSVLDDMTTPNTASSSRHRSLNAWQGREETESLIAMAYFRDRLYLSDGETLLRLEADDTLSTVDIGERKVGHLHAAVGALWAFGPRMLTRTVDGEIWLDAD